MDCFGFGNLATGDEVYYYEKTKKNVYYKISMGFGFYFCGSDAVGYRLIPGLETVDS